MRRLLPILVVAGLLLGLVPAVAAAEPARSGRRPRLPSSAQGVDFSQPITVDEPIGRVELLLTFADAIGPTVDRGPVHRRSPARPP